MRRRSARIPAWMALLLVAAALPALLLLWTIVQFALMTLEDLESDSFPREEWRGIAVRVTLRGDLDALPQGYFVSCSMASTDPIAPERFDVAIPEVPREPGARERAYTCRPDERILVTGPGMPPGEVRIQLLGPARASFWDRERLATTTVVDTPHCFIGGPGLEVDLLVPEAP